MKYVTPLITFLILLLKFLWENFFYKGQSVKIILPKCTNDSTVADGAWVEKQLCFPLTRMD